MSYGYLMGVPGRKAWIFIHMKIFLRRNMKSLIRIYQEYPAHAGTTH